MVRKNQVSYNSALWWIRFFHSWSSSLLHQKTDIFWLVYNDWPGVFVISVQLVSPKLLMFNQSLNFVLIVVKFNPHSNRLCCTTLLELLLVSVEGNTRSVTSPEGNAYQSKVSLQHVATFRKHIAIMPPRPVY